MLPDFFLSCWTWAQAEFSFEFFIYTNQKMAPKKGTSKFRSGQELIYSMNFFGVEFFSCVFFHFKDTDECQDPDSCIDGQCVNTEGSYNCFCTHPMVLDASEKRCIRPADTSGMLCYTLFFLYWIEQEYWLSK